MEASLSFLKKDKKFAALIKKHGPPELNRGGDLFKALVRSIVSQQLSTKAAATIYGRFIMLFNKEGTVDTKLKYPKPKDVLQVPLEKLRSVGLSGQKASYILDLATKFSDGTIKHRQIEKMSTEEVTAHLTQVKGVGVWTVHMLQIFTLGRLDVLPTGDLGVQKGFQVHFNLKKLPSPKEMEKLAEPWRQHASVVSWYMWRIADEAKEKKKK
jgi:DNA-3-methyladenine glycosylase II